VEVIETDRLLLRSWRDADIDPMHAISSDPVVMEHFPRPSTWEETADLVARHRATLAWGGPGLYAVETLQRPGVLIGFVGLAVPTFDAKFTPCVEVGWRLARAAWGKGYATEAARACVQHGFDVLGLDEIVSFTTTTNVRSRAVMERLGMTHDPRDDFDHPKVPMGSPHKRHVLYRLARDR
jgi:RimJ/RimL family protein N-acetyltransferase